MNKEVQPDRKIQTTELVELKANIDPVTNYPYLTQEVVERLDQLLASTPLPLVFIAADIDELKKANDLMGYDLVNQAIRKIVCTGEEKIACRPEVNTIFTFRPHAGGDEFFILAFLSQPVLEEPNYLAQISEQIQEPTCCFLDGEQSYNFECSTGVLYLQAFPGQNHSVSILELKKSAENILMQTKAGKIEKHLSLTLKKALEMELNEAINFISKEWGATRITPQALKTILKFIVFKTKKRESSELV